MKVILHDGERSLTLNAVQMHVLHDLYELYRAVETDLEKPIHADVDLGGRQLTVRAPKHVYAEFKRRS